MNEQGHYNLYYILLQDKQKNMLPPERERQIWEAILPYVPKPPP